VPANCFNNYATLAFVAFVERVYLVKRVNRHYLPRKHFCKTQMKMFDDPVLLKIVPDVDILP
jgi:hypothetical protein